jgi:predicted porin
MQKKIIALAVAGLLSGAAFAQTNVTISGVLDVGANNAKAQNKETSTNAAYNNTATSNIAFRAQEDLGGGLKAGAFFETDIRGAGAMADFQRYVFINGGFGEISLGQRTNFSTTTGTVAQPFGTALGGGYSSAFGRLRGGGFEATGNYSATTGRDVRANGSIRYDSPNFAGFTAGLSWKPENDGANETTASNGHLNLGLNYANGPIRVSYAYAKISNAVPAGAAGSFNAVTGAFTAATPYDSSIKHNLLGANYTFGAFTLYGGYTTSKADTAAAAGNEADSRSWNIAAKFAATGNIDLMANYLRDNDKTAANADRKLLGLGMDYKFSKRTAAYLRYETLDTNTNNSAAGKLTTYGAGLRHAF